MPRPPTPASTAATRSERSCSSSTRNESGHPARRGAVGIPHGQLAVARLGTAVARPGLTARAKQRGPAAAPAGRNDPDAPPMPAPRPPSSPPAVPVAASPAHRWSGWPPPGPAAALLHPCADSWARTVKARSRASMRRRSRRKFTNVVRSQWCIPSSTGVNPQTPPVVDDRHAPNAPGPRRRSVRPHRATCATTTTD